MHRMFCDTAGTVPNLIRIPSGQAESNQLMVVRLDLAASPPTKRAHGLRKAQALLLGQATENRGQLLDVH